MIEIFNLSNFKKEQFNNYKLLGTIGDFDGFHLGHKKIINDMKEFSKKIINSKLVLITFIPNTKVFFQNKSNFLINSYEERIKLASDIGFDIIIHIDFNDFIKEIHHLEFISNILIDKINLHSIFFSENFVFGKNKLGNYNSFSDYKNNLNIVSSGPEIFHEDFQEKKISSSVIRNIIRNSGNIKFSTQLLGHYFFISGVVVHGDHRGKQIGFPTANIIPNEEKIMPRYGVYSVKLDIFDSYESSKLNLNNNQKYSGIANFGIKPSFGLNNRPCLEVHILDFDFDIYGKFLIVYFLDFIREEKKFSSVDSLKNQINLDISSIRI